MKCSEFQKRSPRHHMNLENLDKALHDLGMLSAITDARHDYLRETKSGCSMMRLNTRYVSNVTVGYCMKRATNKNRLCPYVMPVRHRTKSENSDAKSSEMIDCSSEYKNLLFEPSTSCQKDYFDCVKSPTKRCQSLENLNLAVETQPCIEISPEMDCVSTQIQKLQVDE